MFNAIRKNIALTSIILAFCLFLQPTAHRATQSSSAAAGPFLSSAAENAAAYLQETTAQPAAGDALPMFALLQSGKVYESDAAAQHLLNAINEADYTAESLQQLAWDAFFLAAMGDSFSDSSLPQALADKSTEGELTTDDASFLLLVFGPVGVPQPAGFSQKDLAHSLAGMRNTDGGFGPSGISNAQSTARALQALAYYQQDDSVQRIVQDALGWLAKNQSGYGGFDMDGAPSPSATAEVALALYSLHATLNADMPHPVAALLVFQTEQGGFAPNPDSPQDATLTALCLLALTAQSRDVAGLPGVFDIATPAPASGESAESSQSGTGGGFLQSVWPTIFLPWAGPVSSIILFAIVGSALLLVIVLLAARSSRKKKATAQDPAQHAAPIRKKLPKGSAKKIEKLEQVAKKSSAGKGVSQHKKKRK